MIVRRPVLAVILTVLTWGAAGPAATASAATYTVTSCDDAPDGSTNNAWTPPQASSIFQFGNGCADAPGGEYAGLYVRENLAFNAAIGAQQSAYWTFTAPPGTTVSSVTYSRHLRTYADESWLAEFRAGNGTLESCRIPVPVDSCDRGQQGGSPVTFGGLAAPTLRVGARCDPVAPDTTCTDGGTLQSVTTTLYGATVTVEDPTVPTPGVLGGALASGSWLSGTKAASFSATDATGIDRLQLLKGPTVLLDDDRACDYTRPAPCSSPGASTPAAWTPLNTATLPDGPQTLTAKATDAAGNAATAALDVKIDNTPPAAPTPSADFSWSSASTATWTVPIATEPDRAPIDRVDVELCTDGSCSTEQLTPTGSVQTVTRAVGEGTSTLRARLRDQAGNLGTWSTTVAVRRDRTAPPGLPATSPETWQHTTVVPVTWTTPAADAGSPYTSAQIETCIPAESCRIDTFPVADGAADVVVIGTGEGTVRSRLVDQAENPGAWSTARPVRVDITPPAAPQLGTPQAGAGGSYFIPVSVTNDGQSPVVRLTGEICTAPSACQPLPQQPGGATTQAYTDTLAPGTYEIRISAIDQAGNIGAQSTKAFTVPGGITPTPTTTVTPSPTVSATPTATSSPTATVTATQTVTSTVSPTATASPAPATTPTPTRVPVSIEIRRLRLKTTALKASVIIRGASGTVTVTYRARAGGRARSVRGTGRLRRGRVSIRLPIPAPSQARRARVAIRYLGDSTHRRAVVRRRISALR